MNAVVYNLERLADSCMLCTHRYTTRKATLAPLRRAPMIRKTEVIAHRVSLARCVPASFQHSGHLVLQSRH